MTRHMVTQRSPEWHALRCGRLTASCADAILASGRNGAEAVTRRDLRLRLAAERLTGRPETSDYVSEAMQHGIDTEADATAVYEVRTGTLVDTSVGFISSDIFLAGYSPDGIVGEGLLEVKCPKTSTHLRYRIDPLRLASDYSAQLRHALWITGAPWIDIVSYDPRLPATLTLVVLRVKPAGADYAVAAQTFLDDVDTTVRELQSMMVTA